MDEHSQLYYTPLLNDLQNLIHSENQQITEKEIKIRELVNYSVPYCSNKVPEIEPIFDFDFKKDKEKSTKKSFCGYGSYLNGKEYDCVTSLPNTEYPILIGFNKNDYPETVLQKALEEYGLIVNYDSLTKLSNNVRKSLGEENLSSNKFTSVSIDTNSKKKFVPFQGNKKIKHTNSSKPKPIKKKEEQTNKQITITNSKTTNKQITEPIGKKEYVNRIKENYAKHQAKLHENQIETLLKKNFVNTITKILKLKKKACIELDDLKCFDVEEIPDSNTVTFVIHLLSINAKLTVEMTYSHRVRDIKKIIESMCTISFDYGLFKSSSHLSMLDENKTLADVEIENEEILYLLSSENRI